MPSPLIPSRDISRPVSWLKGAEAVELEPGGPMLPGGAQVYRMDSWANLSDKARVRLLRQMVNEYAPDPRWAPFIVANILQPNGVQPQDWPGICRVLLAYVQQNVYYVNEPGERIQSPWRTLQMGSGDCDDMSIVLATMASSLGIPNRFALAGRHKRSGKYVRWIEGVGNPSTKVDWSHIYVILGYPPGQPQHWVSAECILRDAPLGYDVTVHGLHVDNQGRPSVPVGAKKATVGGSGAQPGFGRLGNLGRPLILSGGGEQEESDETLLQTLTSAKFHRNLFLTAIEGVVGAVAIYGVMEMIERRRKRR